MKRVKFRDRKQGKKHIKKRKQENFSKSLDALHSITPAAFSVKERDHFQKTLRIRVATKRKHFMYANMECFLFCFYMLFVKQPFFLVLVSALRRLAAHRCVEVSQCFLLRLVHAFRNLNH